MFFMLRNQTFSRSIFRFSNLALPFSATRKYLCDFTREYSRNMNVNPDEFKSVAYTVEKRVAHITLNRPHRYNAIDIFMPFELERAVELANIDDGVKAS